MHNAHKKQSPAAMMTYSSTTYPCPYLPGKTARAQMAILRARVNTADYSFLMRHGFRRSGLVTYRPDCQDCQACLSVRIPVNEIHYTRSQKRALKKHSQLHIRRRPLQFIPAHFALYQRYQAARHPDGNEQQTNSEQYTSFILQSHVHSFLVEFRDEHAIRMVSLVDQLEDGLSAVYTFFDPDIASASFGVFNIVWLTQQAKQMGLPYLYLGYWIADCRKMAYKKDYHPLEALIHGQWQRLTDPFFATNPSLI